MTTGGLLRWDDAVYGDGLVVGRNVRAHREDSENQDGGLCRPGRQGFERRNKSRSPWVNFGGYGRVAAAS